MKIAAYIYYTLCLAGLFLVSCTTSGPHPSPKSQELEIPDKPTVGSLPNESRSQPDISANKEQTDNQGYPVKPEGKSPPAPPETSPAPRIGAETERPLSGEAPLIAAVGPLKDRAELYMKQGQWDMAYTTAERAVRIDPANAKLWNLLARIRFLQGNFSQAEHLARKSNLLTGKDKSLQADNWKIIAEALENRGETKQAKEALMRVHDLEQ
jgi:tetratricopeptide (TPR) repeat protein